MRHHVYLIPGMFGFSRLASFDYFVHVVHALERRFRHAGQELELHVVDVAPTASIRRRAAKLAEVVGATATDGAIHLLGHSTGGLDARVVASPHSRYAHAEEAQRWLPRLRSVTTMNTPHYGTPLATFFATSQGQRALYALSVFTIIGLSLGRRPLGVASTLIALVSRGDQALGLELRVLDKSVERVLGLVDHARSPEVRTFLDAIKADQGAVLQATPEAMDLMLAGVEDRPGVAYQCTASMAPVPSPGKWLRMLRSPWRTTSLMLFTALHRITASVTGSYPCAALADGDEPTLALPDVKDNDGVVPFRSQLWGKLVWSGPGDHLDVLGHYRDDRPRHGTDLRHQDWLTSGSDFTHAHFEALLDAVAGGMLHASRRGLAGVS
ncbi:MAG: hypothetical protein Q8L48_38715 [Archangium sp.]|nr:hypothetical protein [Archangium sp.]